MELIEFYENGGLGRAVLDRLLRDRRMGRVWAEIERQRKDKTSVPPRLFTYPDLWGAILTALSRANRAEGRRNAGKPPMHTDQKDHAHKALELASRLAAHIEKDGPLDFLAHTLFPSQDHDHRIQQHPGPVERLAFMVLGDRKLNKVGVSLANTTFVELLAEFQRRAQESVPKPSVRRVRAKEEAEKDTRPLTFVRVLDDVFFKHRFRRPMHTAMATIANVTLDLPGHLELSGEAVRRARKPSPLSE